MADETNVLQSEWCKTPSERQRALFFGSTLQSRTHKAPLALARCQKAGIAHMSAHGLSGGFVVASDNDDADSGLAAGRDGGSRLGPRRIVHAHHAQQCQPRLVSLSHLRSARVS